MEQFSELQTEDKTPQDMQNTTQLLRGESVCSYYNVFENISFQNLLTFHHCVGFSGTTTKMQGLIPVVFVIAYTQHAKPRHE